MQSICYIMLLIFIFSWNLNVNSIAVHCSLRERTQIEQLLRYIVEEAPEDAAKGRAFK